MKNQTSVLSVFVSLSIFHCLFDNGVGLPVLTTLVTARPLFLFEIYV